MILRETLFKRDMALNHVFLKSKDIHVPINKITRWAHIYAYLIRWSDLIYDYRFLQTPRNYLFQL